MQSDPVAPMSPESYASQRGCSEGKRPEDEQVVVFVPAHRGQDGRGGENYRKEPVVDCSETRVATGTLPAQHSSDANDDTGEAGQNMHA